MRCRLFKRIEPEAVRLIGDLERESGVREKKGNPKGKGKPQVVPSLLRILYAYGDAVHCIGTHESAEVTAIRHIAIVSMR